MQSANHGLLSTHPGNMKNLFNSAVSGAVKPFKDTDEEKGGEADEDVPPLAWFGPYHVGFCIVELFGPLQLVFAFLALLAAAFLIIELYREGYDTLRFIGGAIFLVVCLYLVWLAKAIYLIKAFRQEIDKFEGLNQQLKGEVQKLEGENQAYDTQNQAHARLNTELASRITDLALVQRQLGVLSVECQGSVQQARQVLLRLERNLKLNTVNSAFLFFDRADADKNAKIEKEEVAVFVDSLSFLWQHLPTFDAESMKASIARKGGITMQQVHKLVDTVMLEQEEAENPAELAKKLEGVLVRGDTVEDDAAESAKTISQSPKDS